MSTLGWIHIIDEAGELLFAGHVREARRASPQVGWALLRLLGVRQTLRAFSQPYLGAKVVNPISDLLPYNADAQSYLASDPPIVQLFDDSTDVITLNPAAAAQFQFQPQFVVHFTPFRFVYLQPEKGS